MNLKFKRTIIIIMAAVFVLSLTGAVFAEASPTTTEAPVATEAPTATEAPVATDKPQEYAVLVVAYNEQGGVVGVIGTASCTSCMGSTHLFINHKYTIKAVYNDGNLSEATDVKLTVKCDDAQYAGRFSSLGNTVVVNNIDGATSFTITVDEPGKTATVLEQKIEQQKVDFIDIIIAAIGVYTLATAIMGSGALFKNEYLKEGYEEKFKKVIRICSFVVGITLAAASAVSILFSYIDWMKDILYLILFGIGILTLIAMLVVSRLMTDKDKKAKAQTGGVGGSGGSAAAFEFDENEPTIDDVISGKNKDNR